jgi:hypothetical protein
LEACCDVGAVRVDVDCSEELGVVIEAAAYNDD